MDIDETMVEEQEVNLPEEIVEEQPVEEEPLDTVLNEQEKQPEPQASEPGWIKGRVQSAVEKALARERESIRAEMEAQYAPIKERLLEMDANELVRKGVVKDLEVAKELVRYRQGQPQKEVEVPQTKDDPVVSARIELLSHQADKIKSSTGIDVMAEFEQNPDVKQKILSGEMDFYDVANDLKQSKKRPPSPMRSPNGVKGFATTIEGMSDAQFARLDKMLDEGMRFTVKR